MSVIVDGGGGSVDTSALVQKIGDSLTGDLTFSNAGIISADTIGMDTSYSETGAELVATRFWNSVKGTTTLVTESGSALDDGQELRFYGKASESISNGDFVQFAGSQGDHVLFKRVVPAEVIANRYLFMGVATTDIANGDFGNVTVFGYVNDINTTGWNQNDLIYVDNSTGQGTNVEPTAGELKILVAVVIKEETSPAAANGEILVRPTWYSRLTELEDINGTPLTTSGQFLVWDNVNGYFDATSNIANFDAAGSAAAVAGDLSDHEGATGAGVHGAGATGAALLALPSPGAIAFLRINADGSVTQLSAGDFLSAINAYATSAFSSAPTAAEPVKADGSGGISPKTIDLRGATVADFTALFPGKSSTAYGIQMQSSVATGGLSGNGFTNATATAVPVIFSAYHGSTAPTAPAIVFRGAKHNGTTSAVALAFAEVVFQLRNWTSNLLTVLGGGEVGIRTDTPGAQLHLVANAASKIGEIIQLATSATANALEIRNSAGTVLAKIEPSGTVQAAGYKSSDGSSGWTGTFINGSGATVTVKNGIITGVA